MPRVSAEYSDVVVVPGAYEMLLAREARWDGRVVTSSGGGFFKRPRRLLEALEAGVPVVVSRGAIHAEPLPWPQSVRSVVVSPHDAVQPSDTWVGYPGCRADSAKGAAKQRN
ncbi:hypothetical protein [Mycolicibacterium mucogenicum]|uniref:Uncharacterized protein n=1 Tax=Mycolicibacterium mucogenicum TaxID=56689 RepID=A0A4V3AVC4_MYCMU|nr:hypothetical protein [Mycolicibacterium mucogenicum]TDK84746.1 hypothetical protein EUA03_24830 [Mycolicibacterium mucogenicum]